MNSEYRSIRSLGTIGGLRRGITTGTCAQAAAKAAAHYLVTGKMPECIDITLPNAAELTIPLIGQELVSDGERLYARCGVIKDSGDDDDVTDGAHIFCNVEWSESPGVHLRGGQGVGTVTRPGLRVAVGESAINPVPRRMIGLELEPYLPDGAGFHVEVSVENGEELAKKTWNPRVGVVGGISIIGTTGIVEPKSSSAFKSSIAAMIKVAVRRQERPVCLTPGFVGEGALISRLNISEELIVKFGDHAGLSLSVCADQVKKTGADNQLMLIGHIGKLAKIAAGMFNTHSKYGDTRLETIAACAGAAGASPSLIRRLLAFELAEASITIIRENRLERTFDLITERIHTRCMKRVEERLDLSVVMLALDGSVLSIFPGHEAASPFWAEFYGKRSMS